MPREKAKEQRVESQPEQPQSGIFEPKSFDPAQAPPSGARRAAWLLIGCGIALAAVLAWLLLRNPFLKPVRRYFKGLRRQDAAVMCEAFPAWLVDSSQNTDVSIYDTCVAAVANTKLSYGTDYSVRISLAEKTEVEESYLERLASGIAKQYGQETEISKGLRVTLAVSYRSDGAEYAQTEYARIYKINGRWVLLDVPTTEP